MLQMGITDSLFSWCCTQLYTDVAVWRMKKESHGIQFQILPTSPPPAICRACQIVNFKLHKLFRHCWKLWQSLCLKHIHTFKVVDRESIMSVRVLTKISVQTCICVCFCYFFDLTKTRNEEMLSAWRNGQFFFFSDTEYRHRILASAFILQPLYSHKNKSWVVRHKTLCALLKPRPLPTVVKWW